MRFYDSLRVVEAANHALQLVENTLLASLITQRSLVQIQPPQPFSRKPPAETLTAIESAGYFADLKVATAVFPAGSIHRPILLEGPAGAGKTELAQSVARALCATLLRLRCYQEIDEEKAIGQYDKSLQESCRIWNG